MSCAINSLHKPPRLVGRELKRFYRFRGIRIYVSKPEQSRRLKKGARKIKQLQVKLFERESQSGRLDSEGYVGLATNNVTLYPDLRSVSVQTGVDS